MKAYGESIGRQLAELLGESPVLRQRVLRSWSHTYGDTRGLREWVRAVELRDPRLRWHEKERGADRLVWPEVDAPPLRWPLGGRTAGCGPPAMSCGRWSVATGVTAPTGTTGGMSLRAAGTPASARRWSGRSMPPWRTCGWSWRGMRSRVPSTRRSG